MKWDEGRGEWVKHDPGRLNPPSPVRDPNAMQEALGIGSMPPIGEGVERPDSAETSQAGGQKRPPMNPAVIDSMSVRELKSAMDARGIRHEDCVERRELVERLKQAACLPAVARPASQGPRGGLDAMFAKAKRDLTLDNPDAWFRAPDAPPAAGPGGRTPPRAPPG
eukprot:CAMPEP_0182897258 /NCGR_PEP_ID=MMETSP0034_2-20130328/26779_1 /TAXON_ID=156128 /ORGANISM="Nephroselmis pyriformis, Strain CCMP717" /LENGTH=165 /DNA_ID=CAMNT_0025031167 /DNA_START=11 /DNA_END=504 /DNA_ORIENTATION=-